MKMEEKAGGDVGSEGGGVRGVEGVGGNTPTPFHTHWFCLAHSLDWYWVDVVWTGGDLTASLLRLHLDFKCGKQQIQTPVPQTLMKKALVSTKLHRQIVSP